MRQIWITRIGGPEVLQVREAPDHDALFSRGGYAFYPKSHLQLIALIADAASAATFALDYRLTPEHSYPAQLEDAVAAYRQLLAGGVDPYRLVIAGDSAGGTW